MVNKIETMLLVSIVIAIIVSASSLYYVVSVTSELATVKSGMDDVTDKLNHVEALLNASLISNNAVVAGRILDKNGAPISGATVMLGTKTSTTGSDGSYVFIADIGSYGLTVMVPGYETKQQTVTVTEKKNYVVDVQLSKSAVIKDTFTVSFKSDASGTEPAYVQSGDQMGLSAYRNIYDFLAYDELVYDDNTGAWITTSTSEGVQRFVPGVAESWEHSSDYKNWTLHIRQGAKFHSGYEVNATAVYWSLNNYMLNSWAAAYWGMAGYTDLFNYTHVKQSIELVDVNTLVFHLDFPNTNFASWFAGSCGCIVDWSWIQQNGGVTANAPTPWLSQSEAGSGPFKLKNWTRGQEMVLERFDDYWGQKPKIKTLIFKVISEISTAEMMLEKGEIDALFSVPPKDAAYLALQTNVKVIGYPTMETIRFDFNVNETLNGIVNPLSDMKVRQAMQYTFPQKEFVRESLYDRGIMLSSILAVGFATYTDAYWDPDKRYNLTLAQQLLAESSYPNGFETTIYLGEGAIELSEEMAVVWQESLAQIGITLHIQILPIPQYVEITVRRHAAPVFSVAGVSYVQDPLYALYWRYHPKGSVNYGNVNDTDFLNMFNQAMMTSDPVEKTTLSHQMQELIIGKGYSIPIYQRYRDCAMNENTKDYVFHWTSQFFGWESVAGPHVEIPQE